MGLLSRFFRPSASKHVEGQYRDGPWHLPITGGFLPHDVGQYANWWQNGHNPSSYGPSAMVETCVSAYAQTIAMCPGDHWWLDKDGGRERQVLSALTRILRKPNGYQTISDFLLNLTRWLYLEGNAFAMGLRNNRNEIEELHLFDPHQSSAVIARDGSVFYKLGGNEIVERMGYQGEPIPARDVLHVRLQTPRHPLKGESPLVAAAMQMAAGSAALQQQIAYFLNQSRPSFVLSSDQSLNRVQADEIRTRWNEQSRGLNTGGVPILSSGLKPIPLSSTAQDAQLAEMLKLNDQAVANVFRVPLQILGLGGTTFASTELLMQSWIASGLGFALNHVEEAFGILFGLKGQPDEYLEFNTRALLRSSFKDRIEGLARGVQGGIFSPDEARAEEELPRVPGGHGEEPRVQQQVVPLSAAAAIPAAPPAPSAPPAEPATPDEQEPADDDAADARDYHVARIAADLLASASEFDRRAA
jgi:HK97 family phage portal protein